MILGVLGLAMGLFMLVAPISMMLSEPVFRARDASGVVSMCGAIGIAMLFLFFETFLVQHRATETGIMCSRPLRGIAEFKWSDIASVEYSATMSWFVLRATDGRKVRVSPLIGGIRGFANLAVAHVERERFSDLSWRCINAAAEGRPILPGEPV